MPRGSKTPKKVVPVEVEASVVEPVIEEVTEVPVEEPSVEAEPLAEPVTLKAEETVVTVQVTEPEEPTAEAVLDASVKPSAGFPLNKTHIGGKKILTVTYNDPYYDLLDVERTTYRLHKSEYEALKEGV